MQPLELIRRTLNRAHDRVPFQQIASRSPQTPTSLRLAPCALRLAPCALRLRSATVAETVKFFGAQPPGAAISLYSVVDPGRQADEWRFPSATQRSEYR